jgi:hypothetical protein
MHEVIRLGRFTQGEFDTLLHRASFIPSEGERIAFLSSLFREIPYREKTLIGDEETPESFVVDLGEVDCMTLIEYVEAMRLSGSFADFLSSLRSIRYRSAGVSYACRNHFFTDWIESNSRFIRDVTSDVGSERTRTARKALNVREDGTFFLPGISPSTRTVCFLPPGGVDRHALGRIQTGDYIGIYTERQGLDVSHAGIAVQGEDGAIFRHASSRQEIRKVVDENFPNYILNTPGIIVLRPLSPSIPVR